ncbi:MAG TPA: hypothetical protein VGI63_08145 [Verrucomicrobiae bacterium]|jgi:hypothetical protein
MKIALISQCETALFLGEKDHYFRRFLLANQTSCARAKSDPVKTRDWKSNSLFLRANFIFS